MSTFSTEYEKTHSFLKHLLTAEGILGVIINTVGSGLRHPGLTRLTGGPDLTGQTATRARINPIR